MAISLFNLLSLLWLAILGFAAYQEECKTARCGDTEPDVRFPFWLKDRQPNHCGYLHPDFALSCSPNNTTEIHNFQYPVRISTKDRVFPLRMNLQVVDINYKSQLLRVSIARADCLPHQIPTVVNFSSSSPLKIQKPAHYISNFTLFNCSTYENNNERYSYGSTISCLSSPGHQVLAFSSEYGVLIDDLSSCTKMYNISDVPSTLTDGPVEEQNLQWLKPLCKDCETHGNYCVSKHNGKDDETECLDIPKQPRSGLSRKLINAVIIGTLLLVMGMSVVLYLIISSKKKKEDQKKIEKFLDDYKALRPSRFSYADIKKITDNFKEKLGEGGYGTVYKGNLSHDILVAVKVLNNFKGNGEEFINEVGTIGTIHHINVVRLIGYCADGYRAALLYEFLPNDSLEKLLSSRKQINSLGWVKLQQIAIGIAKGLDYLHQGCSQRILHFDIKPQNILLDHSFNPKVADFGLAKLCSKEQSAVSMTAARGTIGYIAPEVFSRNFGNVSYKSDVYSFGMLLVDMVGGRKRQAGEEDNSSQTYFPEWMYKKLERGEEIEIQIDKEEDNKIFKKLAIVGLWCIQWCPTDRPSVKVAIQMLEGENIPTMPANPFAAAKSTIPNAFTNGSSSSASDGEICSISDSA